jgi:dolichol-phosphate mannosyltransferase
MLLALQQRPRTRGSISVVVPALNEIDNLEPTVLTLLTALRATIDEYEIVIVDDGSTDGTGEVADRLTTEHLPVRAVHNESNMGIGYSYERGYRAASKEFLVYIPGDNTWPLDSCVELFSTLGHADVIVSYASNPEVRPRGRRILSRVYTGTLNTLFGHRMRYYNGLNVYPTEFLRRLPRMTVGFGFQAEVLLRSLGAGMSYVEIAVPIDERTAGHSKAVTCRNVMAVMRTVLRLWWELRIAPIVQSWRLRT